MWRQRRRWGREAAGTSACLIYSSTQRSSSRYFRSSGCSFSLGLRPSVDENKRHATPSANPVDDGHIARYGWCVLTVRRCRKNRCSPCAATKSRTCQASSRHAAGRCSTNTKTAGVVSARRRAPSEARKSRGRPANCIDLQCALAAARLCRSSTSRLANESFLRIPDSANIEGISHAFVVWRTLRSPPPRWTKPPQSQACAESPNWRLCRRRRGCPRLAAVRASSVKAAACESTRSFSFPGEGACRTARQTASVACSARSPASAVGPNRSDLTNMQVSTGRWFEPQHNYIDPLEEERAARQRCVEEARHERHRLCLGVVQVCVQRA